MKLRRTLLYLVGFGLQRVSTLLLVPLLVSHLPPEDFTRYGLFVSFITLAVPLASMRLQTAPARLLFDYEAAPDRASLIYTCMIGGAALALIVLLGLQVSLLAGWVDDPIAGSLLWLQLAVLACCFGRVVAEHATILVRALGNAKLFLVLTSVEGAVLVGVAALGYWQKQNLYTTSVVAFTLSALIAGAVGVWLTHEHRVGATFRWPMLKAGFDYSWPTALNLVTAWFVAQSGRWVGASVLPLESMANYTLVALLMVIIGMVARTVYEALRPELGKAFAQGNNTLGMQLINKAHWMALAAAVLSWGGIIVVWYLAASRLGPHYQPHLPLLLTAVAAGLIDCFAVKYLTALLSLKQSMDQLKSGIVASAISLVASLWLVVQWGAIGLMIGAMIGFLAQTIITRRMVQATLRRLAAATV